MTIISTHRIHTYKASASPHRRDLSPKKVLTLKPLFNKKHNDKMMSNLPVLKIEPDSTQILKAILATIMSYSPTIHYTTPENSVVDDTDYIHEDDTLNDDDYEEAWAHYDYLEYLYD